MQVVVVFTTLHHLFYFRQDASAKFLEDLRLKEDDFTGHLRQLVAIFR